MSRTPVDLSDIIHQWNLIVSPVESEKKYPKTQIIQIEA